MKSKILVLLSIVLSSGFFVACEKDEEPSIEYTAVHPMDGEWWVTYKVADSTGIYEDIFGVGYTKLITANTSSNSPDKLLITDMHNFWDYNVIANLDLGSRTFSATAQKSNVPEYDILVDVMEGKVIEGGGRSLSGLQTDSIAFKIKFEDDPDGFTFLVSGHRRTGLEEDEFH